MYVLSSVTEVYYGSLDASLARSLKSKYQARFLVCYSERHQGDLDDLLQLYNNPTFTLYDLGERPAKPTPVVASGSGERDG